jgi:predicted MFS family arabinose efflux permease
VVERSSRTIIAPVAGFAAMGCFWGCWAALVPEIKRVVGAADGPFGLALLLIGVGSLPAMLLAGRLWRRYRSRLLFATLVAFAVASLTPLAVASLPALALALLLLGASSGALDVAMNSDVSELEAESGRRLMFGAHALNSGALAAGSLATGLVREAGGNRFTVLPVIAAFFAITAAFALAWPARRAATREQSRTANVGRWILALGVVCGGAFLIEDAMVSWGALHLERTLQASPAIGGAGPGIFAGSMFIGRSSGQLIGRYFSDRVLVVAGGGAAAGGAVLTAVAPSPILALVGFALTGAGIAIVAPALFARAGRVAGADARGSAISALTTIGYLGFVVGPGIVGTIAGASSLPLALVGIGGVALAVAATGFVALRDER